jgi:hypothetical protein
MIRYALLCDQEHEFESWFASSQAYDTQAKRGLITCPLCQSSKVHKALMSPHISTARKKAAAADIPSIDTALPAPTTPTALLDETQTHVRALIRDMHATLTKNAVDVGTNFAQEARDMYDGVKEKRSIYGKASLDEVRDLAQEGIPVLPLPELPDEKN